MNYFKTFALFAILYGTSCTKTPTSTGTGSGSTSTGTIGISYLINTWTKDDENGTWAVPVHFYAGRTDVTIEYKTDNTYILNYTNTTTNSSASETGDWSYDDTNKHLSMTPSTGSPYFFRLVNLTEEQLEFGYNYTTYDNEGVPNGTAEEMVHLEDND